MSEKHADGCRKELVSRQGAEGSGQTHRFTLETSVQRIFDIYIPDALYHHEATQRLLLNLRSLTDGATVYQSVEGDWNYEIESVRVLRLAITVVDSERQRIWEIDRVREAVQREITGFMVDLVESGAAPEEAVFFNDWSARGTLLRRL